MTLAEKSKAIREQGKLTQKQFAEIIGSTQTEISFIEKGFIPPDEAKISRIEIMYNNLLKRAAK